VSLCNASTVSNDADLLAVYPCRVAVKEAGSEPCRSVGCAGYLRVQAVLFAPFGLCADELKYIPPVVSLYQLDAATPKVIRGHMLLI
jgi:hypothetical protein